MSLRTSSSAAGRTACPVVCSHPSGAWYAGVTPGDVPEPAHHDIAGGRVVERLAARRVEGVA